MAIDETKRCKVCGRPKPGSGEPPLPREIECQGCAVEFEGALLGGASPGVAFQRAMTNHQARELDAHRALIRTRFERNAAGKSSVDGSTPLQDFVDAKGNTVTVSQMKADAQKKLDALDAPDPVAAWAAGVSK